MTYAVHVGVKADKVSAFMRNNRGSWRVYADGDGWNSWGEPPGTDVNDADTLLVTFIRGSLGSAIDLALELVDGYRESGVLRPSDPTQHGGSVNANDGVLAVVSDDQDYSVQFMVIREGDSGPAVTFQYPQPLG